jgi:predicted nuclease with TOPRIM domain
MNTEDPTQVEPDKAKVDELLRSCYRLRAKLQEQEKINFYLKKDLQTLEETIKELREDLGSLRVLEAFMRSGVIKDLGLKDDPETQTLLRKFFQINLRRALQRPETLVLSDPAKEIKRSTSSTEGPENERRQRAA